MPWLLGESQFSVSSKHCSTHSGDVAVTSAETPFLFLKKVKKDRKKVVLQLKKKLILFSVFRPGGKKVHVHFIFI